MLRNHYMNVPVNKVLYQTFLFCCCNLIVDIVWSALIMVKYYVTDTRLDNINDLVNYPYINLKWILFFICGRKLLYWRCPSVCLSMQRLQTRVCFVNVWPWPPDVPAFNAFLLYIQYIFTCILTQTCHRYRCKLRDSCNWCCFLYFFTIWSNTL